MARDDDYDDDDDLEEEDVVSFGGPLNGQEIDLAENKRLMMAGMRPLKEVISDAVARRSELVKFDTDGPKVVTSFFVDGVKRPGPRYPGKRATPIIHLLKLLAGLKPTSTEPQRGGMKAEYRDVPLEFTVKTKAGRGGESVTVKIRSTKIKRGSPDDIGLPELVRNSVAKRTTEAGVTLVCGPPESGLSTTARCVMRCVDSYMYQCYAIGDLEGNEILNVPIFEQEDGVSFEDMFEKIKRNEAQAVFVASITDNPELARGITKQSVDVGIVSELIANDAADGIVKYAELLGDAQLAAEQLKCVVSHKLVRKLCPKCREAFRPSGRLLAQMGLPDTTKTLYRKADHDSDGLDDDDDDEGFGVCRRCDNVGFRGRAAIFELIEISDAIKALIIQGADAAAIRAQAKEEKQLSFQKDAMRLVVDGTTGLEELQRVFRGPAKKRPMKKRPMKKRPKRRPPGR